MSSSLPPRDKLHSVAVILVRPRYPENIGAAARICFNFGIPKLIVVSENEPEREKMLKMATHKAAHLINNLEIYPDLRTAAGPFHFLVGTSARQGRHRVLEQTPREVMAEIAPLLSTTSKIGLLFGPENCGLTNADLDYCHYTSTIPTADFSSLNLAQAVAIHCYELYLAVRSADSPSFSEIDYANSHEQQEMFDHIEEVLTRTTFLKDANHSYWMRNIRQFLGRIKMRKKEASIVRGICRKFLWHEQRAEEIEQETESELPF